MFDGWVLQSAGGIDPLDLPYDRFLNLIYTWLIRNIDDEQDLVKFDARLWVPPKGEKPAEQSVWSAENESKAFAAFSAQAKGKVDAPITDGASSTMPTEQAQGPRRSHRPSGR